VHGSVAAAISGGETAPLFGGGVTYRFNRALGLGVELTHVRSLDAGFPYIYCCGNDTKERSTVFTTNVRVEVPTTSRRVIPFVVGGGGVAAVTRSYSVVYSLAAQRLGMPLSSLGLSILPAPSEYESTISNMALTLGGGANFLLTDHVAVDIRRRRQLSVLRKPVERVSNGLARPVERYAVAAGDSHQEQVAVEEVGGAIYTGRRRKQLVNHLLCGRDVAPPCPHQRSDVSCRTGSPWRCDRRD
jgi:hypothetical protein